MFLFSKQIKTFINLGEMMWQILLTLIKCTNFIILLENTDNGNVNTLEMQHFSLTSLPLR